jgi:hypothetical protein
MTSSSAQQRSGSFINATSRTSRLFVLQIGRPIEPPSTARERQDTATAACSPNGAANGAEPRVAVIRLVAAFVAALPGEYRYWLSSSFMMV